MVANYHGNRLARMVTSPPMRWMTICDDLIAAGMDEKVNSVDDSDTCSSFKTSLEAEASSYKNSFLPPSDIRSGQWQTPGSMSVVVAAGSGSLLVS